MVTAGYQFVVASGTGSSAQPWEVLVTGKELGQKATVIIRRPGSGSSLAERPLVIM